MDEGLEALVLLSDFNSSAVLSLRFLFSHFICFATRLALVLRQDRLRIRIRATLARLSAFNWDWILALLPPCHISHEARVNMRSRDNRSSYPILAGRRYSEFQPTLRSEDTSCLSGVHEKAENRALSCVLVAIALYLSPSLRVRPFCALAIRPSPFCLPGVCGCPRTKVSDVYLGGSLVLLFFC